MLWFAIPDDTFHDPEEGDTSNLELIFLTYPDDHSVSPASWIQLNRTSRTLYGLPLDDDARTHRYVLAAADNGGEFARMAFDVDVTRPSGRGQQPPSHEFSVLLDLDYQQFLIRVSRGLRHSAVGVLRMRPRI